MTQLIIGGAALPEASHKNYACWEEELAVQLEMISGRLVRESRGRIWRIQWSYGFLDNETARRALAVLRSGQPFQASALPDDRDELVTGMFLVDSLTVPRFLFSDRGEPVWDGLAFSLREVEPHA